MATSGLPTDTGTTCTFRPTHVPAGAQAAGSMPGLCPSAQARVRVRRGTRSAWAMSLQLLFRPSLVQTLRVLGVDSAVCESISEALEIEDVADLAEAGLQPLLDRIVAILTGFLNDTQWQCLADRTSWLR